MALDPIGFEMNRDYKFFRKIMKLVIAEAILSDAHDLRNVEQRNDLSFVVHIPPRSSLFHEQNIPRTSWIKASGA